MIPHLRQPPASLKSADATPLPGGGYFWPLMKVESLQSLVAKNTQVPQLNLVARVLYIHTRANDIKTFSPFEHRCAPRRRANGRECATRQ
jgi:hypothetical protein